MYTRHHWPGKITSLTIRWSMTSQRKPSRETSKWKRRSSSSLLQRMGEEPSLPAVSRKRAKGLLGGTTKVQKWIIQQLVYKGEQRQEYNFASFKTSIKWAFATIHKIEAQMVYSDCQMTDILMPKIQAEWLQVIRQQTSSYGF